MTKVIFTLLIGLALLSSLECMRVKIIPSMENNQKLLTEKELQAFSDVRLIVDGSDEYIYPEANNVFTM